MDSSELDVLLDEMQATIARLGWELGEAKAEAEVLTAERDDYRKRKDGAYEERNRVVALLVRMALSLGWKAGIGNHEDNPGEDWDSEWRTLVVIELPAGQVSWHIHDSHLFLFEGFPKYDGEWDGHTTPQKYARVCATAVTNNRLALAARVVEAARLQQYALHSSALRAAIAAFDAGGGK